MKQKILIALCIFTVAVCLISIDTTIRNKIAKTDVIVCDVNEHNLVMDDTFKMLDEIKSGIDDIKLLLEDGK